MQFIKSLEAQVNKVIDDTTRSNINAMKVVRSPTLVYARNRSFTNEYEVPEYDFREIDRFYDVESLFSVSVRKKLGLFMKEGWDIVGTNTELVEYVKQRLTQICWVSSTTEFQLIHNMQRNMELYGNWFGGIVRSTRSSGGWPYKDPRTGKELEPIAAIFTIPAATIEIKTDSYGNIIGYRQVVNYGDQFEKVWQKENVVHFHSNKKDQQLVGTPKIVPVMEDIKAFRRIEENIELLIMQNLFPIIHYKVGTESAPARSDIRGRSEIEHVISEINNMPAEGIYVTPERHEIKMLGTEGRALRAESYIAHFKGRVLAGLEISSVDIGEGGTSNRSTAQTMSQQLIDGVKSSQKIFEDMFKRSIIDQLLLEAGQEIDISLPENQVYLRFREIDVNSKIQKENHHTQLFLQNAITHDELRQLLGLNPMTDEEWELTQYKLITEPMALLAGAGNSTSPVAQAASNNENVALEPSDVKKAEASAIKAAKTAAANRAGVGGKPRSAKTASSGSVSNRVKPKNQHSDAYSVLIDNHYGDMVRMAKHASTADRTDTWPMILSIHKENAMNDVRDLIRNEYVKGLEKYAPNVNLSDAEVLRRFDVASQYSTRYVDKLFTDAENILKSRSTDKEELMDKLDSIGYRMNFILRTEGMRAYNWGVATGLLSIGDSTYGIDINRDTDPEELKMINSSFSLRDAVYSSIPPWHPNSTITIKRTIG